MTVQYWHADSAQLPSGVERNVLFTVENGRFTSILPNQPGSPDLQHLPGHVVPGFANTHSHAFHRALRGRTHHGAGTFWTWRTHMYDAAARLTPDAYYQLARAVYAEMVCAGYTSVGEFHYVHHQPDGTPYADPNLMGHALIAAAADAGIRLTLLDTLYLSGGLTADGHTPLAPEQQRFTDATAEAWAERVEALPDTRTVRIGAALHSVRAVPATAFPTVRHWVEQRTGRPDVGIDTDGALVPVHAHVSEQPAENDACQAHYGTTPTQLLADAGLMGDTFTAVHTTHLTSDDIATYGRTRTACSFCPTTERDLADGIGPARELLDAGATLTLGSDQHAMIDPFEEARAVEKHERLTTLQRGRLTLDELRAASTAHHTLGWPDAGQLSVGQRADLVCVDLTTPRTAGIDPAQVLYAATAADVRTVVIDGRQRVTDGKHTIGDVGALLAASIAPLTEPA